MGKLNWDAGFCAPIHPDRASRATPRDVESGPWTRTSSSFLLSPPLFLLRLCSLRVDVSSRVVHRASDQSHQRGELSFLPSLFFTLCLSSLNRRRIAQLMKQAIGQETLRQQCAERLLPRFDIHGIWGRASQRICAQISESFAVSSET